MVQSLKEISMSICDDARKSGVDKINAAYNPLIEEIARIIKHKKGLIS
jgi:hypothetical protein